MCLYPSSQAIKLEYARLLRFAQEDTPPENDYRLQHAIVYFIQNQAPKKILERTLLTQFADRNLSFDERYIRCTLFVLNFGPKSSEIIYFL